MSDRLIPLDEAAKLLNLSTEELTELRSQNEIFGYRDGSGWKFKRVEIERFADERGVELAPGDDDDLSSDAELIADDSDEVSLRSESSGLSIGADEIDLSEGSGSSHVLSGVEGGSGGSQGDTNRQESELGLAAGSSSNVLSGDEAEPGDSPSDTGKMVEGEELLLAEDDLFVEDELRLEEDSDEISLGPDSEISSDFEESDLIIDADSSSEIMLDSSDSGINLSPTDSGISLEEEPLQLGGSDIDSLELPEDDDEVITLEEPEFEDSEAGADDDFMLTPVESLGEDDDTSGSQVIALEDSEIYADSSSGSGSDILSASDSSLDAGFEEAAPLVPDEPAEPVYQQAPVVVAAPPEADYSIWNILALMCVAGTLAIGGILVYDVLQHIHHFDQPGNLSQTVMDFVLGWVDPK